jgi:hypothetical protein
MREMASLAPSMQDCAIYTQRRLSTAFKDHLERESEKYQNPNIGCGPEKGCLAYVIHTRCHP